MSSTAYAKQIDGLTWDEYRAYPLPSQSDLKAAWDDAQLWHETNVLKCIEKPGPSASQQWGTQCEAMLRDGPNDAIEIIPPEVLTSNGARRGKAWEAYRDANADKQLVTEKEYLDKHYGLERAVQNVSEHRYATSLLADVEWSVRIEWDNGSGFQMKGELDCLNADKAYVVDVKTATDNSPEVFQRDAIKWGYDIQAAAYLEAASILLDADLRWFWVVVQNKAPWKVEVYQAIYEVLEYGRDRLVERQEWFDRCRETDTWRSPTLGEIVELNLPNYLRERVQT